MTIRRLLALAFASTCFTLAGHAASFASAVEHYDPGTGFATEFGSGLGYTNAAAALGEPNRQTAFGPVDPFSSAFERSELVSLGTNGSLTVRFANPIRNDASHAFGLDFIIYGSTAFIDNDYPNGVTDSAASTFGHNPGQTRVSVSTGDGVFYTLNPVLAPVVDGLFPTDGAGTFGLPVDPALAQGDFATRSLAEIRTRYAGSAGGSGYDLAWAVDAQGAPISLPSVSLIRVDVLSGRSEIDGFAMVPEPSTTILLCLAALAGWVLPRARRARPLPAPAALTRSSKFNKK